MQRIKRRAELAELEENWQSKCREWMLSHRHGQLPQKSQVIADVIKAGFALALWAAAAMLVDVNIRNQGVPSLFFVPVMIVAVVFFTMTLMHGISRYRTAEQYETERQDYLKRRAELSEP